ncbi:GNAT family N-acetyltransferase [Pedobacter gandavensis]|uniref:GNAT family N-acetyltransferase n=1 Tax=Pedobacter gandavensis TaxID=2679963 RepID=UPI00292DFFBB|nr:GNAT family N-acetyltransferase [Pedobacter gandavensis]
MNSEENKLNNPVWFSLIESHHPYSVDFGDVKCYHPDYCPFGGFTKLDSSEDALDEYSILADNFFVVGDKPNYSNLLRFNKELVCCQMLLRSPIQIEFKEEITSLKAEHKADLLQLVNLVQPGYFRNNTPDLGNYYGIYKGNELVAVTGERMKMNAFTEVSAVVTHPDHTGKGYAKQLVAHTANQIFLANKIPYLHVAESNTGAIRLYEKLGFVIRRKISFWNFMVHKVL